MIFNHCAGATNAALLVQCPRTFMAFCVDTSREVTSKKKVKLLPSYRSCLNAERRLEYEIDFIIIIRLLFLNCYQISQATQLEGIKCKNSHLLSDTYFIDRNREKKIRAIHSGSFWIKNISVFSALKLSK